MKPYYMEIPPVESRGTIPFSFRSHSQGAKPLFRCRGRISLGCFLSSLFILGGVVYGEEEAVLRAIETQLHLHGWSNHNRLLDYPASMQMHSYYASTLGTEVLWWTEHGSLLAPPEDLVFPLLYGRLDPTTWDIVNWPQSQGPLTGLEAEITGGRAQAQLIPGELTMRLHSDAQAEDFQSFRYHVSGIGPWSCGRMARSEPRLSRPLVSEPVLILQLETASLTEDTRIEVIVHLAAHYREGLHLQSLNYQFVPPREAGEARLEDNRRRVIPVPVQPGMNRYELNLQQDAALLPEGMDNTLSDLSISVQARRGAVCQARFREVRLTSRNRNPDYWLSQIQRFAAHYREAYGVTGLVGCEYDQRLHINAFLPPDQVTSRLFWPQPPEPRQFVAAVHRTGGVVSLNYPLGDRPSDPASLDPPSHQRARVLRRASHLLEHDAYGADLLEVGYLHRGGSSLRSHLSLWDILLANGLFLCGVGVSDAHGGGWEPLMEPNPFVSWLWARNQSALTLIEALRHRRVFFGNPFLFTGTLDLELLSPDASPLGVMGDVLTLSADTALLQIRLKPPSGFQTRLYQGLLRSGRTVVYLQEGPVVRAEQPVLLDTSAASFVRVEVWDRETPVAFSNPIVMKKP